MIEIHDLWKSFGDNHVLKGITLSIPEGSFAAVMGSNGSGKSTLARCMNGLYKPTGGSVLVDGLRTDDDARSREIRRKVGLAFQDPNLQMTSVLEGLYHITTPMENQFQVTNCGKSPVAGENGAVWLLSI